MGPYSKVVGGWVDGEKGMKLLQADWLDERILLTDGSPMSWTPVFEGRLTGVSTWLEA